MLVKTRDDATYGDVAVAESDRGLCRAGTGGARGGYLAYSSSETRPEPAAGTWYSPPAGKPDNERVHPLGDERGAGGRPASRRTATADQQPVPTERGRRPDVAEITGAGREWTVSMISLLSIPWR
jgi:hypothetical protein